MKRWTWQIFVGALLSLCACAANDASPSERGGTGGPALGGTGGPLAGLTGGVTGGGPANQTLCPASNLTQACSCPDGRSGRSICTQAVGWGACDCGQGMASTTDEGPPLLVPDVTPTANLDTSAPFDDFVRPRMLNVGDCKPGNYLGTFECGYAGGLNSGDPFQVGGVVSFALTKSANSEALVIEDGLLDGWGIMWFFAYLAGELSCATGELTGTAFDGFYNPIFKGCSGANGDMPGQNCIITDPDDPNYPAPLAEPWMTTLEGFYAGSLDPSTDTINGTWSMFPLDIGGSCDGTFSVMLVP